MKKYFVGILLAISVISGAGTVSAAPERLAIKTPEQIAKEDTAVSQIKDIDIRDIEDPAARRAIEQILNYLGLQTAETTIEK